jgi:hypothetical protein
VNDQIMAMVDMFLRIFVLEGLKVAMWGVMALVVGTILVHINRRAD